MASKYPVLTCVSILDVGDYYLIYYSYSHCCWLGPPLTYTLRQVGVHTTTNDASRSVSKNCDPTAREPSERSLCVAAGAGEAPASNIRNIRTAHRNVVCLMPNEYYVK
jgi:hypothetical protein